MAIFIIYIQYLKANLSLEAYGAYRVLILHLDRSLFFDRNFPLNLTRPLGQHFKYMQTEEIK